MSDQIRHLNRKCKCGNTQNIKCKSCGVIIDLDAVSMPWDMDVLVKKLTHRKPS